MSSLAQGTKAMLGVLSRATSGRYTIHVRRREGDRLERYATQVITLDVSGYHAVITGDMGTVSRLLAEAMDELDGGYLALTWMVPDGEADHSHMTWVWHVLAGTLIPLKGDEGWHVLQHYPTAQGSFWLSAHTWYGDAWDVT
jgi:hypothetical protein